MGRGEAADRIPRRTGNEADCRSDRGSLERGRGGECEEMGRTFDETPADGESSRDDALKVWDIHGAE